jgi:hypothetical protein
MLEPAPRRPRTPPRRHWTPLSVAVIAIVVLVAFLVGLSLGRALEEGPAPTGTTTGVRTLTPLPLPPATTTVTVTR